MKVSVILTTKNEKENIKAILDSLIKQTRKPDEIIIIDDYSTDKTYEIVKLYKRRKVNGVKFIIKRKKCVMPEGRNIGASYAKGDILILLDADIRLTKNWIKSIINHFKESDVVAVYGDLFPIEKYFKARVFYRLFDILYSIPRFFGISVFAKMGTAVGLRKRIFEKVGGYATEFTMTEDLDLSKKLRKEGKIKYVSEMKGFVSLRRFEKVGYVRLTLTWIIGALVFHFFGEHLVKKYKSVE